MVTIVGIRFKRAGKIYYFSPEKYDLEKGDHAIVETARGIEYGEVVIPRQEVEESQIVSPLKTVIRKANEADARKVEENHRKEKEAFVICEKKIAARKLDMHLVNVEYTFDVGKIIFYFTADGRIDFRELVKDLAAVFRTGSSCARSGYGMKPRCWGHRLLRPASVLLHLPGGFRTGVHQNGQGTEPVPESHQDFRICGRLLCCLKYESDMYCGKCCKKREKKKEQNLVPRPG